MQDGKQTIGLLGTTYKKTDLADLEIIYIGKDNIPLFIQGLPEDRPLSELVILSTCNRMELYFQALDIDLANTWLQEQIARFKKTTRTIVADRLTLTAGNQVLDHLFEVVSGLDSMVYGENEILTQVQNAYETAHKLGLTLSYFNKLFQSAAATGKRVRHETQIGRGAYSVSSIAVEAIRERILDYFGRSILVIGSGTMGRRVLEKLDALGHPNLTLTNRTQANAEHLAKTLAITVLPFSSWESHINSFDIVVIATSVSHYLLTSPMLDKHPTCQLIIDMGLPRNVDPVIGENESVTLKTVSDLQDIAEKSIQRRKGETEKVKLIVAEEREKYTDWVHFRDNSLNTH